MALLDWLEQDSEEMPGNVQTWLIPVTYRKWGVTRVVATSEEEALSIWEDLAGDECESLTTWDGVDELEIDWCGSIEPE